MRTRWNSLLAGGLPSSTIVCRPALKLWPALSAAASVIRTSGSWFSKALQPPGRLEPDEPDRRHGAGAERGERDQHRRREHRGQEAADQRDAAHDVEDLDRADRQVAALHEPVEPLPELPALERALGRIEQPGRGREPLPLLLALLGGVRREVGPDPLLQACALHRRQRERRGEEHDEERDDRHHLRAEDGLVEDRGEQVRRLRVVRAGAEARRQRDRLRSRLLALPRRLEERGVPGAGRGRVVEHPRALELGRDGRVLRHSAWRSRTCRGTRRPSPRRACGAGRG